MIIQLYTDFTTYQLHDLVESFDVSMPQSPQISNRVLRVPMS